jgi:hypothetical protein
MCRTRGCVRIAVHQAQDIQRGRGDPGHELQFGHEACAVLEDALQDSGAVGSLAISDCPVQCPADTEEELRAVGKDLAPAPWGRAGDLRAVEEAVEG